MTGTSARVARALEATVATFAGRVRVYAAVGLALFLLGVAAVVGKALLKDESITLIVADARSYYMYLPSLVIDGDLDFSNQIVEHWGCGQCPPALELLTPRGYVRNKYPIGLALTLTPAFLLAHGASLGVGTMTDSALFAADGYSLLYQLFGFAWIAVLGVATIASIDRLATGAFGVGPVFAVQAALAYWLGSSYLYYFAREPFMVHVASTFWITVTITSTVALQHGARNGTCSRRWLLGHLFALAMAVVCRPTNVFAIGFLAAVLLALGRAQPIGAVVRSLLVVLVPASLPVAAQVAVWYRMSGQLVHYSYGHEGFRWLDPALWQTLLSSNHGLLFWAPLLVIALWGWFLRVRGWGIEPLTVPMIGGFVALWYLNSAWWSWWFGGSFGGRSFIEASPVLILGLAFGFERVAQLGPVTQRVAKVFVITSILFSWALMVLYIGQLIPRDDVLF